LGSITYSDNVRARPEARDVKPLGPAAAREIGTFSLKTKGPNPQEVTGKYIVVWEKVGNDWQLAADIWNDGR
jgi:ketosteroid isomerase-like protein